MARRRFWGVDLGGGSGGKPEVGVASKSALCDRKWAWFLKGVAGSGRGGGKKEGAWPLIYIHVESGQQRFLVWV